ncbi:MAG: AMP-binding protein, partial [Bacteroidales bacterium]
STYKEIRELARLFGAGLLAMGLNKGDRVGLIAEGCNNWIISELGILYAGGVNVPLSARLGEPSEIQFRLDHSEARMVIASRTQIDKIRKIKSELTSLETIILLHAEPEYQEKEIYFGEILEKGKKYLETNLEDFEKTWTSIQENDHANICYTSGTTADPKGIILSHLNYVANVEQGYTLMDIPPYYKTLLVLAWDHSFGHTVGLYAFMGKGASIASVEVGKTLLETTKNIQANIKEIKPNIFMSVPTMAKAFRKGVEKAIQAKGPFTEKLFRRALKLAYNYNKEGYNRGRGIQVLKKPLYNLYDRILFKKIREGLGFGNIEFVLGGGALLDIELQRFFYAIGIPMLQGYGLTEAAPIISGNSLARHKLGSSGFIVKNLEIKICDDDGNALPTGEKGEIVVKGENVMVGYWKNEEATKETLKDGWLHTGDLGYMDEDGFLFVLGRFKSLLIADDGEKYSPEGIEEAITEHSRFVDQCMLYNNQNPYTIVLIYPNYGALKNFVEQKKIAPDSEEGKQAALNLIQEELNHYRTGGKFENMFPQRWLPAAIGILEEGFTEDNLLLNSTLKIVRGKIVEKYKELIDFLYTPEAKNITNSRNMDTIGRMGG